MTYHEKKIIPKSSMVVQLHTCTILTIIDPLLVQDNIIVSKVDDQIVNNITYYKFASIEQIKIVTKRLKSLQILIYNSFKYSRAICKPW